MYRTRVRRRAALAAILATGLALGIPRLAAAVGPPQDQAGGTEQAYVVRPGDTLWDLAVRWDPASDPRQVVDGIARVNGIVDGALVPGQTLIVPTGG